MNKIYADLNHISTVEKLATMSTKLLQSILSPLAAEKRILKYNQ